MASSILSGHPPIVAEVQYLYPDGTQWVMFHCPDGSKYWERVVERHGEALVSKNGDFIPMSTFLQMISQPAALQQLSQSMKVRYAHLFMDRLFAAIQAHLDNIEDVEPALRSAAEVALKEFESHFDRPTPQLYVELDSFDIERQA